jgi:hypothetical protein
MRRFSSARGRMPASPARPGPLCEHGFHPFPDLGRLASLDVLRAGSGGLTTYTTTPLEPYCHRLRAEFCVVPLLGGPSGPQGSERT